MVLKCKSFLASMVSVAMILIPAAAPAAAATQAQSKTAQHVVSAADLQRDVAAAAGLRKANEAKIEKFFGTPQAREAMKKAGINYEVVQQAVPQLSSAELARLAARADRAQQQFQAGALSNQQLTYIIIALATAVLVIIIFTA